MPIAEPCPAACQPQERLPGMLHQFPRRVEDQKPQALGPRREQFRRQGQALQRHHALFQRLGIDLKLKFTLGRTKLRSSFYHLCNLAPSG